ncbi:MAG: ATP-binding protein [Thermodesulfobacteriota bacterium]|nr:ATP-binding protein [Thermodesulfobacteriota bacterium]
MNISKWWEYITGGFLSFPDEGASPERYKILRRNIVTLMLIVTVVPISLMAFINHHQYQTSLKSEIINPLYVLANKTKHSFELFLEERLSTVRFIASAYSFKDLSDEKTMNRIFRILRKEVGGFVDLGLIDSRGIQVSYAGPYALLGKDYSKQSWFQEAAVSGAYISDVFMGYRQFPHIAIAAQHLEGEGNGWILRSTIDTKKFDNLIAAMGLDPHSDAFLVNNKGIFQTNSKFYGKVLEPCPFSVPQGTYGTYVIERKDHNGREILITYSHFLQPDYTLVMVRPRSAVLKTWFTLKSELFFIYIVSIALIILIVFKLTNIQVNRIKEADEKRELTFRELEHTQKISSIGRLAAGVAHEINNPLAIINEKAGLMKDLVEYTPDFQKRSKFLELTDSIIKTVERCRAITHRLLGFARRMEVEIELLDLNELLKDVYGFLEKESIFRDINVQFQFADALPRISSDRGQLQQVFLNILTNAFAAVEDGGSITITSWEEDLDNVATSVMDNGCGMSEETVKHIFEPFFTTKKGYGTGLGLPITYGIVKKLGGDIKVKSKQGEGTTFTVYLPKKSIRVSE